MTSFWMKAFLSSLLMCFRELISYRLAYEIGTTRHLPIQQHISTVMMQKYRIMVPWVFMCFGLLTPFSAALEVDRLAEEAVVEVESILISESSCTNCTGAPIC